MKISSDQKQGLAKTFGPPTQPCATCSCKIQVGARKLGSLLVRDYYHMYIVFTDDAGKEWFLRAGPDQDPSFGSAGSGPELTGGASGSTSVDATDGATSGASGSGSNPIAGSDSGNSGPYGHLIGSEGAEAKSAERGWRRGDESVEIASGANVCAKYAPMVAEKNRINAARLRYSPMGPNSNSFVFALLRAAGLAPRTPDGVWAPGDTTRI